MAGMTQDRKEKRNSEKKPDSKNFRRSSDVENFYRFISTNHLRREARMMLSHVVGLLKGKSGKRKSKGKSKIIQ